MAATKAPRQLKTDLSDSPDVRSGFRVPPQAVEVEKHVIGGMLLDPEATGLALEALQPEDFYLEKHQVLFEALQGLFEKNVPADLITVAEALKKAQKYEMAGGDPYLLEISSEVVSSANVDQHCQIVKEKSLLRRLIGSATKMLEKAYEATEEPRQIMDEAEGEIYSISESTIKQGFVPIKRILSDTFKLIESYSKGDIIGVPTGFKDFDTMTSGFQKTDLIILAGRPAMGKTALALSMLANAAIDHKKTMAFFSLEMGREQLVQRILCRQAQVNMHLLRTGRLPQRDFPKLSIAVGPISEAKVFIDDHPNLNILELRAKCRRLKAQQGLDMVMVDYLQLMQGVGRQENRQQEISQISRGLKGLAKELEIPVLALSQLSRAVEQRGGEGEPKLSDLRESGAIEQDADIVLFVYRDEVYNKDAEKGKAKIIIAKQRNGPTGDVPLTFVSDYASFMNYSGRPADSDPFMG
ncbi:MAG TPA: replicative DNA helicase [Fibrobacteria bacterium]|nr:replicative DNA helicase [Fibrobacteria bacterium]